MKPLIDIKSFHKNLRAAASPRFPNHEIQGAQQKSL